MATFGLLRKKLPGLLRLADNFFGESFMKHESNFIEVLTITFNPYYSCFSIFNREFFLN